MPKAILTDEDYFDLIDDIDADSPPCVEGCECPLCVQADRDEAALLARLDRFAAQAEGTSVKAHRPWVGGDQEAA